MKSGNWFSLMVVLVIIGWFYWFQYRPSRIRAECSKTMMRAALETSDTVGKYSQKTYDSYYTICLTRKGIAK